MYEHENINDHFFCCPIRTSMVIDTNELYDLNFVNLTRVAYEVDAWCKYFGAWESKLF